MAKNDVCAKVQDILLDFLDGKDLELYMVQFKKEGPDWKLKVFLDKPEGSDSDYVGIDECEEVTRYLSQKLDEEDFIDKAYYLEVSSPGLDRELIKESDFRRFKGRPVEVKLYEKKNGVKNFEGSLIGKEGDLISIELSDGSTIEVLENEVSKINLAVIF